MYIYRGREGERRESVCSRSFPKPPKAFPKFPKAFPKLSKVFPMPPKAHLAPRCAYLASRCAHLAPRCAHLAPRCAHLAPRWAWRLHFKPIICFDTFRPCRKIYNFNNTPTICLCHASQKQTTARHLRLNTNSPPPSFFIILPPLGWLGQQKQKKVKNYLPLRGSLSTRLKKRRFHEMSLRLESLIGLQKSLQKWRLFHTLENRRRY